MTKTKPKVFFWHNLWDKTYAKCGISRPWLDKDIPFSFRVINGVKVESVAYCSKPHNFDRKFILHLDEIRGISQGGVYKNTLCFVKSHVNFDCSILTPILTNFYTSLGHCYLSTIHCSQTSFGHGHHRPTWAFTIVMSLRWHFQPWHHHGVKYIKVGINLWKLLRMFKTIE